MFSKRLFVGALLVFGVMSASVYDYNLHMTYKRGPMPNDPRVEVKLNNETKLCSCGKPPVFVMFLYGDPEFYCPAHLPEIERVISVSSLNIDDILKETSNWNGTHNG